MEPLVNGRMAPAVILDVEEVTAMNNCRAASGGLPARTESS
jgi:hypothetical protein